MKQGLPESQILGWYIAIEQNIDAWALQESVHPNDVRCRQAPTFTASIRESYNAIHRRLAIQTTDKI